MEVNIGLPKNSLPRDYLKHIIAGLDKHVKETYGTYKIAPKKLIEQRKRWVKQLPKVLVEDKKESIIKLIRIFKKLKAKVFLHEAQIRAAKAVFYAKDN